MIEIERKFLVTSTSFLENSTKQYTIEQGFLSSVPERTVRVRIKDEKGFLTVKGKSNQNGMSRFEWEKEILLTEAQQLLQLCEKGIISKIRHEILVGNHVFEVDVFAGDNSGLILAEIELSSEDEAFEKPNWLGKEVTGTVNYYNSYLSKNPFKTWEK